MELGAPVIAIEIERSTMMSLGLCTSTQLGRLDRAGRRRCRQGRLFRDHGPRHRRSGAWRRWRD